jgi:Trk K+ transport system NAD-binding subunit
MHQVWAGIRDTRVLLYEFRKTLVVAGTAIFGGAALLTLFYEPGPKPDYLESVYAVLEMLAFQGPLPFPGHWPMRLFFIMMPVFSAVVIAESLVRFGVLFFNRKNRMEAWNVSLAATLRNHVVVAGLGRVGYRIALELIGMGESVVAIESSPSASFLEGARAKGVVVLTGDARAREQLLEANVPHARAVIASTNNDLANVEVALTAREIRPGIRVVIRMFDPQLAEKFSKSFDMETFSTTAISAPVFAAAATDRNVVHSFYLGEQMLSIAQLTIETGSGLAGKSVQEIEGRFDASIVVLMRSKEIDFHPAPDVRIAAGDRIGVLASMRILTDIEKANATG